MDLDVMYIRWLVLVISQICNGFGRLGAILDLGEGHSGERRDAYKFVQSILR